jgi:antitoxin component HigA of HigAB toxin-antitoxin module
VTRLGLPERLWCAQIFRLTYLTRCPALWFTQHMKSGAEQLLDWMKRRGFTATETSEHFGWDLTFVSKLINGRRLPGLTNAVKIERETGIPVEAWLSSGLDTPDEPVGAVRGKRK